MKCRDPVRLGSTYSGAILPAVIYKNWKFYYAMAESGATGCFNPLIEYNWTMVQNIKRDPFEQAVGSEAQKRSMSTRDHPSD